MNLSNIKVGEIVRRIPGAQEVFYKYNIDFCCNGWKTLKDVCTEQNIDIEKVMSEIENSEIKKQEQEINPDNLELDELIDFIYENYHLYIEEKHPIISGLFEKVIKAHGNKAPYLQESFRIYNQLISELAPHLKKEELILFPAIKNLVKQYKTPGTKTQLPSVRMPITIMEQEHDASGVLLKLLKQTMNNFIPPEWACPTMRKLFDELNAFERNILEHIHIENHILFPKALKMENSINQ